MLLPTDFVVVYSNPRCHFELSRLFDPALEGCILREASQHPLQLSDPAMCVTPQTACPAAAFRFLLLSKNAKVWNWKLLIKALASDSVIRCKNAHKHVLELKSNWKAWYTVVVSVSEKEIYTCLTKQRLLALPALSLYQRSGPPALDYSVFQFPLLGTLPRGQPPGHLHVLISVPRSNKDNLTLRSVQEVA